MKKENFLDSKFLDWSLKIGVFFVFSTWVTIAIYLFTAKALNYPNEYPMERLGQAGDFFNIATSLASFVTVLLVYSAYIMQKRELKAMKDQIKEEEVINRTIKEFEKWLNKDSKKTATELIIDLYYADFENHIDFEKLINLMAFNIPKEEIEIFAEKSNERIEFKEGELECLEGELKGVNKGSNIWFITKKSVENKKSELKYLNKKQSNLYEIIRHGKIIDYQSEQF